MPEWTGEFNTEAVADFVVCYGYTTEQQVFEKFSKHLRDTKRADHHRVSTAGPTRKSLMAELQAKQVRLEELEAQLAAQD